jgi:hypothetical protein
MKSRAQEPVEHHACPADVAERLRLVGGTNRFGEPMFRLVWGYDRIVPITGEWQEFEQFVATLTDKIGDPEKGIPPGFSQQRLITRLKSSVIETRHVPKYMPGNCWHLEMWRPPEEYGSPENWGKLGEEVIGTMTVDTAGPYPSRGEYELCYPLTDNGTSHGRPIPLVTDIVLEIVRMIVVGRERFTMQQRIAAIEQEHAKKEEGFVRVTQDRLKDALRPHAGETSIVVP